MSSIVLQAFITLDGVVQAGGGPDEDREGGFEHGGWQGAYDGGEELIMEWESRTEALLLGRETYDIWARSWGMWDENAEGLQGEFTRRYNRVPKYVASRTLTELAWQNSHLLGPDVPAAVAALRAAPGGEIRVWGSTELVRTLAEQASRGVLDPSRIDEATINDALYTAGMPDPDLLIRSSGEMRLSNFLTWQSVYTELWVTPIYWPDFRRQHLYEAIGAYQQRQRRFGGA